MPELPEVETVIRYLKTVCLNKKIKNVNVRLIKLIHDMDAIEFQNKFLNRSFINIIRRGKYLVFILDNNTVMVSHLRMEGKYIYEDKLELNKHDHVIFNFEDKSVLKYNDSRQFGTFHFYDNIDIAFEHKSLKKLGVEPFSKELNVESLYKTFSKTTVPIKTSLLNQSIIAGIGNIYANEILYKVGLDPCTKTNSLSKKEVKKIIDTTNEILADSIEHNGTTIHSFKFNKWSIGDYQNYLLVHGKKMCPKCGTKLDFYFVGQRGTYSCPKCQRKHK